MSYGCKLCDSDNAFRQLIDCQKAINEVLSDSSPSLIDMLKSEKFRIKRTLLDRAKIHILLEEDVETWKWGNTIKQFKKNIGGFLFFASLSYDGGHQAYTRYNRPQFDVFVRIENDCGLNRFRQATIDIPPDRFQQIATRIAPDTIIDLFRQASLDIGLMIEVHLPRTNMPANKMEAEFLSPDAFYSTGKR